MPVSGDDGTPPLCRLAQPMDMGTGTYVGTLDMRSLGCSMNGNPVLAGITAAKKFRPTAGKKFLKQETQLKGIALNVTKLREEIPQLFKEVFHSNNQKKMKSQWDEDKKPKDWPSHITFTDPNNVATITGSNGKTVKRKPNKEELIAMYDFLKTKQVKENEGKPNAEQSSTSNVCMIQLKNIYKNTKEQMNFLDSILTESDCDSIKCKTQEVYALVKRYFSEITSYNSSNYWYIEFATEFNMLLLRLSFMLEDATEEECEQKFEDLLDKYGVGNNGGPKRSKMSKGQFRKEGKSGSRKRPASKFTGEDSMDMDDNCKTLKIKEHLNPLETVNFEALGITPVSPSPNSCLVDILKQAPNLKWRNTENMNTIDDTRSKSDETQLLKGMLPSATIIATRDDFPTDFDLLNLDGDMNVGQQMKISTDILASAFNQVEKQGNEAPLSQEIQNQILQDLNLMDGHETLLAQLDGMAMQSPDHQVDTNLEDISQQMEVSDPDLLNYILGEQVDEGPSQQVTYQSEQSWAADTGLNQVGIQQPVSSNNTAENNNVYDQSLPMIPTTVFQVSDG